MFNLMSKWREFAQVYGVLLQNKNFLKEDLWPELEAMRADLEKMEKVLLKAESHGEPKNDN